MKKIILFIALIVSVGAFAQEPLVPMVTVTGEGSINIVPDQVVINTRVEHTGKSSSEVKKQNDEVVDQVIKHLKGEGIPAKNIRTDYIRLKKEYDYNTKEYFFSANQAISIHLEDLDKYEEIMSGLLESGLNRIDGIEFKTSKEEELKSEARRKAILNAKQKAQEYAEALGQEIGKAVTISESGSYNPQPVYRVAAMKSFDSSSESIAPGEMEVNVTVNVGFLLE